jgi:hypothetical protein
VACFSIQIQFHKVEVATHCPNSYSVDMDNNPRDLSSLRAIQEQMMQLHALRQSRGGKSPPISLSYSSKSSFTTRTKAYKQGSDLLDCSKLHHVIEVDLKQRVAIVEARVTMEALVAATLPYGLIPAVVPELRAITVGGAIMGMGAESGSYRYGCFNDICNRYDILNATGEIFTVSAHEHPELFYGIAGSYGSLGLLLRAEIRLIPAKEVVLLRYHCFQSPAEALRALRSMAADAGARDFLDGIIFSESSAVIIEGLLTCQSDLPALISSYCPSSVAPQMYYQHIEEVAFKCSSGLYQESMSHQNYLFRYDFGTFWMGAYMSHLPLVAQLMFEGVLHWLPPSKEGFTQRQLANFCQQRRHGVISRAFLRPLIASHTLNRLLHYAEKWVQDRFVIQDLCVPEEHAQDFLSDIFTNPGVKPIWLLPIRSTDTPQLFAPHCLSTHSKTPFLINFGLYGLPANPVSLAKITRRLEKLLYALGGRKVLYSRSEYTVEEFWQIYPHAAYRQLRQQFKAAGCWHEITDKVLSR